MGAWLLRGLPCRIVNTASEHALGLPLLEIYSPIREIRSGKVIAVAEFYEIATQLQHDLNQARALPALTASRPISTSVEQQTFRVNTPATAVPSASST